MKIDILSVREPVWANAQQTLINCWVRTTAWSEELPFTADPNDDREHGSEIFRMCVDGEFGEISPYIVSEQTKNYDVPVIEPKWMKAWPEVHNFIVEANAENSRNSSRAIGLIWGSMLETMLNNFIECKLKNLGRTPNDLKLTYSNGKECGITFEARINGAFAQKMIDTELKNQLHAIREIRNECAHEWNLSYENPKIEALKDSFSLLKSAYAPTFLFDDFNSLIKMVFRSACCEIIIYLAENSEQDGTDSNTSLIK